MMLIGRYSPLILDSWTRPKYLRGLPARRPAKDTTIVARLAPRRALRRGSLLIRLRAPLIVTVVVAALATALARLL